MTMMDKILKAIKERDMRDNIIDSIHAKCPAFSKDFYSILSDEQIAELYYHDYLENTHFLQLVVKITSCVPEGGHFYRSNKEIERNWLGWSMVKTENIHGENSVWISDSYYESYHKPRLLTGGIVLTKI